jgi:hypothetical protein
LRGVLTVKSVLYVLVDINLIDDLIRVILQRRGENNDLIVLCHKLDKVHATGAHQEVAVAPVLNVVDQGFIQIKHQSVGRILRFTLERREEGWGRFREICEVVWELSCRSRGDGGSLKDREGVLSCERISL